MSKLEEYFFRALIAAVMSLLIVAPIAGVVIMLFTGVHGSQRFAEGMYALTTIVLFFTPWVRDSAANYVKELAQKEAQRKAYEKERADWARRQREKIESSRKTIR